MGTDLFSRRNLIFGAIGVVVLAALGAAIYFFVQYQNTQAMLKSPNASAEQEVKTIVDEVGKLIELPQGEQPQVATVSDVEKLKDQQFFSKAKNGDKVLIYTKAQKAILYDPLQKKVIEVGPINLAQATPTPAAAAPTPAVLKVALLNGTTINGLTTKTEQSLKQTMPNVTVVTKGNASQNTYEKTIVVDVSGKQTASAQQLAKILGGEVGPLPTDEQKPIDAEIVVILGGPKEE